MAFEADTYDTGDLETLFDNGRHHSDHPEFPFLLSVTTAAEWIPVVVTQTRYGACVVREPQFVYNNAQYSGDDAPGYDLENGIRLSAGNRVTKTFGQNFPPEAMGGYLVWGDSGTIAQITSVAEADELQVSLLPETITPSQRPASHLVHLYGPDDVLFNALQFDIAMDQKEDPIAALEAEEGGLEWPVLKMILRNILQEAEINGYPDYYVNAYNEIANLKLLKSCVQVGVKQLNTFNVSTDDGVQSASSPFEPFGSNPENGAAFYFGHAETTCKQLDSMRLDIEWMGAPEDFKSYYENYWLVDGLTEAEFPYHRNTGYTGELELNDRSLAVSVEDFDYTETFAVATESSSVDPYQLSGKPLPDLGTPDFVALGPNGEALPVLAYLPWSQAMLFDTGDIEPQEVISVYYDMTDGSMLPAVEELLVGDQYPEGVFTLKLGVHETSGALRTIIDVKHGDPSIMETGVQTEQVPIPVIVLDTRDPLKDELITVTYPTTGSPYLFSAPNATNAHHLTLRNLEGVFKNTNVAYNYDRDYGPASDDDVREWARFWEFRLKHPDFYHSDYSRLLTTQQVSCLLYTSPSPRDA